MANADFWNQRYAEAGFAYGMEPNDFLRQQAPGLEAGRALCLAEGKGRNAVHLASLRHAVIAQDLSDMGLSKARQLAAERGLSIETLCRDLADYTPEPESVDLVVAIWMHLPPALRIEPEELRSELEDLEWLVLQEQRRWPLGRKPLT